jgi:hypothetical protein
MSGGTAGRAAADQPPQPESPDPYQPEARRFRDRSEHHVVGVLPAPMPAPAQDHRPGAARTLGPRLGFVRRSLESAKECRTGDGLRPVAHERARRASDPGCMDSRRQLTGKHFDMVVAASISREFGLRELSISPVHVIGRRLREDRSRPTRTARTVTKVGSVVSARANSWNRDVVLIPAREACWCGQPAGYSRAA